MFEELNDMILENLAYTEVEQYLQDNDTILIPVGSVEQHSEYGIIGTDFITAEGIAREVGEKMGILTAPTLHYGVSPHHLDFKGSATLSPTTFIHLVIDICLSFVHHGFRRIIFINGHGGNRAPLTTAFQEIKMKGIGGQFAFLSWYEGLQESDILNELFQGQDGKHATPSEISLTMALRPQVFTNKMKEKKENDPVEYYWPLTAEEMRTFFPDGRMGAASWLASEAKGMIIKEFAVQSMIDKIEEMQKLPIL
jgi:creatinine amidohydrolase